MPALRFLARPRVVQRLAAPALLSLPVLFATPAHAQAPGGRLQFVLPPSTWRLTVSGEVQPAADVRTASNPLLAPLDVGVTRGSIRLGAPVIKRGLYTTIVTNDVVYDRFGFTYTPNVIVGLTAAAATPTVGPDVLQSVSHELGVSHAVNPRWRLTGALQHGFFTGGGRMITTASYRAAGGAFVSRVYRPTLQVGAGVVALNVAPYVIPTIRVLHVGAKWRTDVLLPRAETFRDVGHGVELGGVLRFVGNRFEGDGSIVQQTQITRTTYQQAMLGPALTWRAGSHGFLQAEAGAALRRMRVTARVFPLGSSSTAALPLQQNLDTNVGALLRVSGRLTF